MLDTIKNALLVGSVAAAGGICTAVVHGRTDGVRQRYEQQRLQSLVAAVLPTGVEVRERSGPPPLPARFWEARRRGRIAGYAFLDSAEGFGGLVTVAAGIDTAGRITGVRILDQNETPQRGARIAQQLSGGRPWFCAMFEGLDVRKTIAVKRTSLEWPLLDRQSRQALRDANAVCAVAGATRSSAAVVSAVRARIAGYAAAAPGVPAGR